MSGLPKAWFPYPVTHFLSYKERVKQVFSKQIPCAFSVYSSWYGAWWYWLLLPWILPFQIAYCGVLLAELLLLTIFLPVTLIPYLDFLLFIVQFLSFVCCYIVALIGLIPQNYVKYKKLRDIKTALKSKGIKRNLRKFDVFDI